MTRNKKFAVLGLTLTALAMGLTGCASTPKETQSSTQEQTGISPSFSGKVTETMDAGGYTYVCLEHDGKKTWAALPTTKLKVGQEIKIMGGAVMPGFSSKALNRTFDNIVFSGGLVDDSAAAGAAANAMPTMTAAQAAESAVLSGKVVETMNAASYTYLLIEKDGKKGWAAVPSSKVKVGDQVELIPGVDMGVFKSATLKRNFDNIHFSTGFKSINGASPAVGASKADAAKTAPAAGTAPAAPADAAALPPGHPKMDAAAGAAAPAAPAAKPAPITGKVVETIDGGGYTYICLEKDKAKTWVAIPATEVAVGQEMTLPAGSVMHNFASKTLNRTFEQIIFTSGPAK